MRTFDATQAAIVAASPQKVSWLFTVVSTNPTTYRWATLARSFGGNAYAFKVKPETFSGIQLNRAKSEAGLQVANTVTFDVIDSGNALTASDFPGGTATIDLVMSDGTDEEIILSFKFTIKDCRTKYQCLRFTCEDFVQDFLKGDYPTGKFVRDIFPSDDQDQDSDIIAPVPFGCAYPPIQSVYVNGDDRYYLLGPTARTYNLNHVYSPQEYGPKADWDSGLTCGLIHYLRFDENTGTTAGDSTLWGNDGTLGGTSPAARWSDPGYINSAYWFDDTTATGAACGNSAPLSGIGDPSESFCFQGSVNGFAISFWLKNGGDFLTERFVFYKYQDAGNNISVSRDASLSGGELRVTINGTVHETSLITNIWDGSWHMVTINFNKTAATDWQSKVYIGTTLEDTYTFSAIGNDISNTGNVVWGGTGVNGFKGQLDEARIYNHPLSAAELTTLFNYTASDFYTFTQSSKSDGVDSWKVCQLTIADSDNDGTADANGLWRKSGPFLPPPISLMQDDTYNIVAPGDVIEWVMEDMGVASGDIDTGASSSFETANATYVGWGLEFHGAYYKKKTRKKIIANLLNQCHSTLDITDKIELRVLSKTSQKTITKAEVIKESVPTGGSETVAKIGTFNTFTMSQSASDSGYIQWQEWGRPQDRWYKSLVPAKAATDEISNTVLELPFVHGSVLAQKLGSLFYQRKFLKQSGVSFKGKPSLLALQPDDIITINHADYGGSYAVLIDSITINHDCSMSFRCIKFSAALDDIGDLSPGAITVNSDDTNNYEVWQPAFGGPGGIDDNVNTWARMEDKPYLTVSPTSGAAMYETIQEAINAATTKGARIYLMNSTAYAQSTSLTLPANKPLAFIGESLGGVIVSAATGVDLFVLSNLKQDYLFQNFTINSLNSTALSNKGSKMINISGTASSDNDADVIIRDIDFKLKNPFSNSSGDQAIKYLKGTGVIDISNCNCDKGLHFWVAGGVDGSVAINSCLNLNRQTIPIQQGGNDNQTISILNNNIKNPKQYGIQVLGSTIGEPVTINGNTVSVSSASTSFRMGIDFAIATDSIITSNTININATSTAANPLVGINAAYVGNTIIENNRIKIVKGSSIAQYGVKLYGAYGVNLAGNNISVDDTGAGYKYGVHASSSYRSVIDDNYINGVNNSTNDIGIYLSSDADNNQGTNNITYLVGTSVSDNGTGNAVTANDSS